MKCIHKDPYIFISSNSDLTSFNSEATILSLSEHCFKPQTNNNGINVCIKTKRHTDRPLSDIQLQIIASEIKQHRYWEDYWIIGVDDIDNKCGNSIALSLLKFLCNEDSPLYDEIPDPYYYSKMLELLND